MASRKIILLFITIFWVLTPSVSSLAAKYVPDEKHVAVSLRMVGHQMLLKSGDSTSRVLPVQKIAGRYKLSFEGEFEFVPQELVSVIDQVVKQTYIASRYIVEVQECNTEKVVYSYEIGHKDQMDIIPCQYRTQPRGCYDLYITIIEAPGYLATSTAGEHHSPFRNIPAGNATNPAWIYFSLLLLTITALFIYYKKHQRTVNASAEGIYIGKYLFDSRMMQLSHNGQIDELSSKEADLLTLLYQNANDTVERDLILKSVWGDDGGYVGRTLDVFISKLRKKLQNDPHIKIVNVRGVGYKLILENA